MKIVPTTHCFPGEIQKCVTLGNLSYNRGLFKLCGVHKYDKAFILPSHDTFVTISCKVMVLNHYGICKCIRYENYLLTLSSFFFSLPTLGFKFLLRLIILCCLIFFISTLLPCYQSFCLILLGHRH